MVIMRLFILMTILFSLSFHTSGKLAVEDGNKRQVDDVIHLTNGNKTMVVHMDAEDLESIGDDIICIPRVNISELAAGDSLFRLLVIHVQVDTTVSETGNYSDNSTTTNVYLRKNYCPTELVYDQKQSIICTVAESQLLISSNEMLSDLFCIGFSYCCNPINSVTITISLQEPVELNTTSALVMLELIPGSERYFSLHMNQGSEVDQLQVLSRVFIDQHVRQDVEILAKYDQFPSSNDYDFLLLPVASGEFILDLLVTGSNTFYSCDGYKFNDMGARQVINLRVKYSPSECNTTHMNYTIAALSPVEIAVKQINTGVLRPAETRSQFFQISLQELYQIYIRNIESDHLYIEYTLWDIPWAFSTEVLNNTSVFARKNTLPINSDTEIVKISIFSKDIVHYQMKSKKFASIKFSMSLNASVLFGNQESTESNYYVGLFYGGNLTLFNGLAYESAFHFYSNVLVPSQTTKLNSTTWSLLAVGVVYAIVAVIIMAAFTYKFYEKLVRQELTTFDSLSERDFICFPCLIWFGIFGDRATRKVKQMQILIPALGIFTLGLISALIFGAFSASSYEQVFCCSQRGSKIYRKAVLGELLDDVYIMKFEYKGPPTYCFTGQHSPFKQINDTHSRVDNAKISAKLSCFRGSYQRAVVRGNDTIGTIGTLVAGISFIISFVLIMTLLIELLLSTWYCERIFGPRLIYHLTNE